MILFRVSNLPNWNYFENNFIIPLSPVERGQGEGVWNL
jgi:hypothetical protein